MANDGSPARRDFLKGASAAAWLPANLMVHVAPSASIRVGVIGCGGRGEAAAMNAMNAGKDIRIVALGDILLDRAQEKRTSLKLRYPGQVDVSDDRLFAGFQAFQGVIANSDVVIIANAAKFHPYHLKTAIEAGKHVFVEKPHAIDPAGVKMVQAATELARQKGLCVVSGLQSRYHPGYIETMQRVHDGAIGDIVAIQETWLRPPYVVRQRRPKQKELEFQASNQYHFHWLSGDDVPQTLIHNLDRSSWALRNAAPLGCYGMGGRSTLRGEEYGSVFDHHSVVYDFPNGVRVYALCRTIENCYNENSSLILGTKGRCDLLKLQITGAVNWKSTGNPAKNNAYDLEHVALFEAIRAGRTVNNGDYMARSTLIPIMGQLSCYTGKEMTWEQVSRSNFYYAPRPEEIHDDMEPPIWPGPDGLYPVMTPGVTKLI
jgi:predicted dehydrogenase